MSRRNKSTTVRVRRDAPVIARRPSLPPREAQPIPTRTVFRYQPSLFPDLIPVEDNRRYHPEGKARPRLTKSGQKAQVRSNLSNLLQTQTSMVFQAPPEVLTCVRRNARKEVMHALNKAGKTGQKKPKRNFWSSISCKGK